MACRNICSLCRRLILSQSIEVDGENLAINIPEGGYEDDQKYCLVTAQNIPATATVNQPVVVTIGTGTEEYPLVSQDGTQILASQLRSRTRYATVVQTSATSGVFKLCGRVCGSTSGNLASIDGTAPVTLSGGTEDTPTGK